MATDGEEDNDWSYHEIECIGRCSVSVAARMQLVHIFHNLNSSVHMRVALLSCLFLLLVAEEAAARCS